MDKAVESSSSSEADKKKRGTGHNMIKIVESKKMEEPASEQIGKYSVFRIRIH